MSNIELYSPTKKLVQINNGDFSGTVLHTQNIDTSTDNGRIRPSEALKLVMSDNTDADFDYVCGIDYFNSAYHILTGGTSSDGSVFIGNTGEPDAGYTQDVTAGSQTLDYTQALSCVWNSAWTLAGETAIVKWNGTSWSNVVTSLTDGAPHIMAPSPYNNNLYYTENGVKIWYQTSGGSDVQSGNGTLNLTGRNWVITAMRAGSRWMWIGVTSTNQDGTGAIIKWDMSSTDSDFNDVYYVTASGVFAIEIGEDDKPYAMTSTGVLLKYNGAGFSEVARLPIADKFPHGTGYTSTNNVRWIHPDGMRKYKNGRLLINISNLREAGDPLWEMPGGVWEYSPENGLYHKFALNISPSGAQVDYGQSRVSFAGPVYIADDDDSTILVGGAVYRDSSNERRGLWVDDTDFTVERRSLYTTPFILSSEARNVWQKVFFGFTKMATSTDKIIVKYRTERDKDLPVVANVTWSDSNTFTSTDTDFQYANIGDELEILNGNGAGTTAHITAIALNTGTYTIDLDETNSFISASNTGTVRVNNWIKAGTISSTTQSDDELPFMTENKDTKIQLRFELRGTNDNPSIERIILLSEVDKQLS